MHVIESEGTDPLGPYHHKGKLAERNALDVAYHINDLESDVCDMGRTPCIQKFGWNADGTLDFGVPVARSTELAVPSGE